MNRQEIEAKKNKEVFAMENRYVELLSCHRWRTIIMTTVLMLFAISGVVHLTFTSDYKIYFDKENKQLHDFSSIENNYSGNENILFVLSPKDGQVFSPDQLIAVEWLTEQAWNLPRTQRVDSITNFQDSHAKGDEIIVAPLIEGAENFDANDIKKVKRRTLSEHELVNRLISPQGNVTGVNTTFILPAGDIEEAAKVVAAARKLAIQFTKRYPDIEIRLTGIVMFNHAFTEVSEQDFSTLVSIMYAVVFVVLALMLRSVSATITSLMVTIFSIGGAMGIVGWLGYQLNPVTATAPTIILTLTIANCIHLYNQYNMALSQQLSRNQAISASLQSNFIPIMITNMTTIVGFLCLNFSDSPPFRELGNTVAIGLVLTYMLCMVFVPVMMCILPVMQVKPSTGDNKDIFHKLSKLVIRRPRTVLTILLTIVVVLASFAPMNQLDDRFVEYFSPSIPFRADTDYTVANLTGIYTIQYSLDSGKENGINDPEYMRTVESFADWWYTQAEVIHVSAISDTVKRLNKNLHEDKNEHYLIPDHRQDIAQNLLLYELSLPYGLNLNNQVNLNKSASRITILFRNLSTQEMLALEARAANWLSENLKPSMTYIAGSPNLMFAHISERNVRSMLKGNILALVLISALIMILLRNFRIAAVSIITNLLPVIVAFGFWALWDGQVGLSLSGVVAITLGIVVDDTVHFLSKYLKARRDLGKSPSEAVSYSFDNVGRALWVTSVVLVFGFSILTLSNFELNAELGLMTAVTIIVALIIDFFFLPALLLIIDKAEEKQVITNEIISTTYLKRGENS